MSFGGATDEGLLDLLKDNSVRIRFRANGSSYLTGGSFGIGTTSPSEYLEVNGGNAKITSSSNVYLSLDTTQTNGDEWHIFNAVSGTKSGLQFKDIDTSKLVMLLQEDGNVGIGTASPSSKLHIKDATNPPEIRFEDAAGGTQTAKIVYDQTGQNSLVISTQYDSSTNVIQLAPADNVAMTLKGNGYVGIGTTTPSAPLDTVGRA